MFGVHANAVVASVADKHVIGNWAVMKFVANAVRAFITAGPPAESKGTVSVTKSAGSPFPAPCLTVDFELR